MNVRVVKNKQFPQGVVDLRGLEGGEVVLMDARLGQTVWLKGRATGSEPLFGTMQLHVGQGPYGFGFELAPSAGDAPLTVQTSDARDLEASYASIYELTEQRVQAIQERP